MLGAHWAEEGEGSFIEAAPSLKPFRHPNAGLVAPLWLGDGCEGLSGLYAAINGVRLALAHQHRFTRPEIHALMRAGLRFLDGRLSPQQCVLAGLRVQLWRGLVEAIAAATRNRVGLPVFAERIHLNGRTIGPVLQAVDQAVMALRVPLILCRGGVYTVVSGTTPSSVLLFDSRGGCWISKRLCGVPRDNARHVLYPSAFMALGA